MGYRGDGIIRPLVRMRIVCWRRRHSGRPESAVSSGADVDAADVYDVVGCRICVGHKAARSPGTTVTFRMLR